MRTGLVLGAGGTAGEAFHRGVIRAMDDHGVDPRTAEIVVGTSAGSLVAASLRRHAPLGTRALVTEGLARQERRGILPDRSSLLDLARRPRQGLNAVLLWPEFAAGRRDIGFLSEGLRRSHGSDWPEAALWVVAVRRRDGRRVVFGRADGPPADLGSAVAASCAIPGYFTPVTIGGTVYVDGGVHSPTNADLLAGHDLDLVVVSSPMSVELRSVRPRLDLPMRLRFHQFLRGEVWALRRGRARVVTIEPDSATLAVMGLNMMSGRHVDEVEERAYAHARRVLSGWVGAVADAEAG